jgi:hypothetical protein
MVFSGIRELATKRIPLSVFPVDPSLQEAVL